MSKPSYRGPGNGFPFGNATDIGVLILNSDQDSQWNNDRANYMGPLTEAQAVALFWRVKSFTLTSGQQITGGMETENWVGTPPDGGYEPGALVDLSDDFPSIVMTNAAAGEALLANNGPSVFTGSASTTNFDVTAVMSLFNLTTFIFDDSGHFIDSDTGFNLVVDADGNYWAPCSISVTTNYNAACLAVYQPQIGGVLSPYAGSPAYVAQATSQFGGSVGGSGGSTELSAYDGGIDLAPDAPIMTAAASEYWDYDGRYDSDSGGYSEF